MGGACGNCEEEEEGKDLDQMHVFLSLFCLLMERTSVYAGGIGTGDHIQHCEHFYTENLEPTHHSGDWMPSIYNLTPGTLSSGTVTMIN